MGISPMGLLFALFFIVVLLLSYFNNFNLNIENKKKIALIFPFLLTIAAYLLILLPNIITLILFVIFTSFLIFYYVDDNESLFAYLNTKTAFRSFIALLSIFIIGGILFNAVRFNHIDNEILAIIIFFVGTYLFIFARAGFISLTSQIALNKGRNKFWGILGFLGAIGFLVVYLLPKVKDEA